MNNPFMMIGVILALAVIVGGGLLYVANTMEAPQEQRQDVVPNDRFPG